MLRMCGAWISAGGNSSMYPIICHMCPEHNHCITAFLKQLVAVFPCIKPVSEDMFQTYLSHGWVTAEGGANQRNKLEKRGRNQASDW